MTATIALLPTVTDSLCAARLTLVRPGACLYERFRACEVLATSPHACDRALAQATVAAIRRECRAQYLLEHDRTALPAPAADPMPAMTAASSAAAPSPRAAEAPIPAGAASSPPRPTAPAPMPANTGPTGTLSTLARWTGPLLLAAATGYLAAQASFAWRALTLCTATGC